MEHQHSSEDLRLDGKSHTVILLFLDFMEHRQLSLSHVSRHVSSQVLQFRIVFTYHYPLPKIYKALLTLILMPKADPIWYIIKDNLLVLKGCPHIVFCLDTVMFYYHSVMFVYALKILHWGRIQRLHQTANQVDTNLLRSMAVVNTVCVAQACLAFVAAAEVIWSPLWHPFPHLRMQNSFSSMLAASMEGSAHIHTSYCHWGR